MHTYRLYVYDNEGHLIGPALPIPAEDDQQAILHAAKVINENRAELFDDQRLVIEFQDGEPRSP